MGSLKVAIVGAGQGTSHGKVFAQMIDETEVVAVCDLNEARAKACASLLGVARVTSDYEAVLRDRDVDIVAIAIGCHLHGVAVVAALEAGKHVVVEVPAVGTTVDMVWKMVHAAERGRLKVQMGNHERWQPQKRKMKEMISAGEIGEIILAEGDYTHDGMRPELEGAVNYMRFDMTQDRPVDDPPHWRLGYGNPAQETMAGGGGLHAVDSLRWLMGEEFCEVMCYGNRKVAPYRAADDMQTALFKTPSGAVGRATAFYSVCRKHSRHNAVYGTDGSLEFRWHDDRLWLAKDNHSDMTAVDVPEVGLSDDQKRRVGHGGMTYFQDRDFVDSILEDRQPEINVYEAARSCAAAICAGQSALEGRPVRIPSFYQRMT
jgi:predicted dehydrogenase